MGGMSDNDIGRDEKIALAMVAVALALLFHLVATH
jgi:hypothetical protein